MTSDDYDEYEDYDELEAEQARHYAEWCEWWDALSPEDKAAEQAAIDLHTSQQQDKSS